MQGALTIAQIRYPGEFNPDRNAMDNFQGFLRQSLNMPTEKIARVLDLTDPELKFFPVLTMTGHDQILLSGLAKTNLKAYLIKGGFLIVDACCTRPEFDNAFRFLIRELFPGNELMRMPSDSPVYHEPFELAPEFNRPPTTQLKPRPDFLWGLRLNQRYVVVYSPWDPGCSMDNHLEKNIAGIKSQSSYETMTNILSYGLSY